MSGVKTGSPSTLIHTYRKTIEGYDSVRKKLPVKETDNLVQDMLTVSVYGALKDGWSAQDTAMAQNELVQARLGRLSNDGDLLQLFLKLASNPLILHTEIVSNEPELYLHIVSKELSRQAYDCVADVFLEYEDRTGNSGLYVLFDPEQADQVMPGWRERCM